MNAQETRVQLEHLPESIALARRVVADMARELPEDVASDATLLTSELVTNAIRYGGPNIELSTTLDDAGLTVAVYDDGAGVPAAGTVELPAEAVSGRGLQMVHRVAQDWGVRAEEDRPGKTVWFRVSADAEE